jgi:hypothetical protein
MNYNIKKIKTINILSDGSFLITKNTFSNKINFLEKDFQNSSLWLKLVNLKMQKNSNDNLEYRSKFLYKKNKS